MFPANPTFLIPFYLKAVHVHLANGVNLKKGVECSVGVHHLLNVHVQLANKMGLKM
jgi:hypothetical protein